MDSEKKEKSKLAAVGVFFLVYAALVIVLSTITAGVSGGTAYVTGGLLPLAIALIVAVVWYKS